MSAAPGGISRYAQIAHVLKARLELHDAGSTAPFTTEQALCQEFGVSRTTIRLALNSLKREGLIVSRAGVGTKSTATARRVVRTSGDPLHGMLDSKPRILSLGRVPAPAAAAKFFSIPPGTLVFQLTRVHDLDGSPLSVVRSYLPAELALPRAAWRQPMHELLWDRFGLQLARSVHTLRVARATTDVAELLGIGLADPVLRIQASTYLADDRPVRWTENFFREDRYEYSAEMQWPAPRRHDALSRKAITERRRRPPG